MQYNIAIRRDAVEGRKLVGGDAHMACGDDGGDVAEMQRYRRITREREIMKRSKLS